VLFTTQVQSRAAQLLRRSPAQVRYLQAGAVARGLERRSAERVIAHVTLDEKSLCAGQHYVSVLCDGQQGAVLEVVEHRTQEAATQLLEQGLSESQRTAVQVVTADMWKPYASAAHTHLPQADLVPDRFHLSGYLNEVVDQTQT
jgi:transposase